MGVRCNCCTPSELVHERPARDLGVFCRSRQSQPRRAYAARSKVLKICCERHRSLQLSKLGTLPHGGIIKYMPPCTNIIISQKTSV